MKSLVGLRLLVLGLLSVVGCAGIRFDTIESDADDEKADGIRYYEAKPFLLIYSDGKGGLVNEILYLPDLSRKRSADPFAFMATNETTLSFTSGVLTQGLSVTDETMVPKAILEAAATVAGASLKNLLANHIVPGDFGFPPPVVFEIRSKAGGIELKKVPVLAHDGTEAPPIRLAPEN